MHKDVNAVLETIAFQQGKAVAAIMDEPDFAQLLEESFHAFKRESLGATDNSPHLQPAKSPAKLVNGELMNKENNNNNVDALDGRDSVGGASSASGNNNNGIDVKYCSACNISFTYRNSYLAHKKYYCSSNAVEA